MAKQPKKNDAEVSGRDNAAGRHPAAMASALFLAVAGIAIMLLQKFGVVSNNEWLGYAALGCIALGVLTWFLSGMERQHRIEWIKLAGSYVSPICQKNSQSPFLA